MKPTLACILWAITILCAVDVVNGTSGVLNFVCGMVAEGLALLITVISWQGRNRERS
jgi:hypothetical protein